MTNEQFDDGVNEFLTGCPERTAVARLLDELDRRGFRFERKPREGEQSRQLRIVVEHTGVRHDKITFAYHLPEHRKPSNTVIFRIQFKGMQFPFDTEETHKALSATFERITGIKLDTTTKWRLGTPKFLESPLDRLPRFLEFLEWWRMRIHSNSKYVVPETLFPDEVKEPEKFCRRGCTFGHSRLV